MTQTVTNLMEKNKIANDYREFKIEYRQLVDKHSGIIETESAIIEVIKLVLSHYYGNDAELVKIPGDHCYFVNLFDKVVALIEYSSYEQNPILFLSFIVGCQPNISAYMYNYINKYVHVPVISHHVFYPKPNESGYTIVYNEKASEAYKALLSNEIYQDRCKQENAVKHLQKIEKHQLH